MSPTGSRHAACVDDLAELFFSHVHPHTKVRIPNPIHLSAHSEPQPDLALLERKRVYASRLPRPDEVLLVVEVADTTMNFDRRVKIPLYAEAGMREYWIVNLAEESLDVYRQPGSGGYAETTTLQRGDEVEILALPDAGMFSVEEILNFE